MIALQVGIQATGNYGVFNVLTSVLALQILAPAHYASATSNAEVVFFVGIQILGVISLPHNSYTTNAWPYCVPPQALEQLPAPVGAVAKALLSLLRILAPFHVSHGNADYKTLPPTPHG